MMRMFQLMEQQGIILSITLADGDRQVGELQEVISACPCLKIAIGHLGMANPPLSAPWENKSWQAQIKLARHITYRMSYDFICKTPLMTEAEKHLFLGENARRFYGFETLKELPYIKNMSE